MKKVHSQHCINQMILLLPPGIQKRVRFTYIKSGVLFFVLNHPGAKMEFDNIIKSIKKPLKEMMALCDQSIVVDEIKAFVTHKPSETVKEDLSRSQLFYDEQSHASFENHFEQKKLYDLFEEIRKIIHETTLRPSS